jgi:hypothetical protein
MKEKTIRHTNKNATSAYKRPRGLYWELLDGSFHLYQGIRSRKYHNHTMYYNIEAIMSLSITKDTNETQKWFSAPIVLFMY